MNKNLTPVLKEYMLSLKEHNLILELRELPYAEVVVVMHDGQPDRIERGIEKKKL